MDESLKEFLDGIAIKMMKRMQEAKMKEIAESDMDVTEFAREYLGNGDAGQTERVSLE